MRIIRLIPFFAMAYGGSVNHVKNLCKELEVEGVHNIIYTSIVDKSLRSQDNDLRGVEVKSFKASIVSHRGFFYTPAMKDEMLHEDFDIIHAHLYRNYQCQLAAWLARKTGRPFVFTAHGTIRALSVNDFVVKKLYDIVFGRKVIKQVNAFVAVTPEEVKEYAAFGVDLGKVHVIEHGIDAELFKPSTYTSEFSERFRVSDSRVILYAGRLHRRKGIHHLIQAFATISKEYPDLKLVIAGPDDGFGHQLKKICERLRLDDRVIFTGHLPQRLLVQAYNVAYVVVYPTKYEIFGHTLLEAAACGKPCIAVKWGAATRLVEDGKTGILTSSYGNLSELQSSIVYLLERPSLVRKMGLKAREICNDFSWRKCAAEHIRLYEKLLVA